MAEPTPEDMAAAGIEMMAPENPEPSRVEFEDAGVLDEVRGDRKIVLASGEVMRERFLELHASAANVVTDAANPAATEIVIGISNALIDENNWVVHTATGQPMIADAYPVNFTVERLGAEIGSEADLAAVLLLERQAAAAKAAVQFKGMRLAETLRRGHVADAGA